MCRVLGYNKIMDYVFIAIAFVLLVLGLVGAVLPVLPGPPIAWAGLLVGHFSSFSPFSVTGLVVPGIAAAVVTVLDYVFPSILTKASGGSRMGSLGCTIGLFVGLFLTPIGVIVGPFCGAFIGEMMNDNTDTTKALKAALGAFLGFLTGTGLKLILAGIFIWIYIVSLAM